MNDRIILALAAVCLLSLMAVLPAAAAVSAKNGTVCEQGATIFIGEQGLNVTHALNQAYWGTGSTPARNNTHPLLTSIGWWPSETDPFDIAPAKTIDLGVNRRYTSMIVAPADFVGYIGDWYLLNASGIGPANTNAQVFTVVDPALDLGIWDYTKKAGANSKLVPQGEKLGFRITTNMSPAVDGRYRNNVIDNSIPGTAVQRPAVRYVNPATNVMIDSGGSWENMTVSIPNPVMPCCDTITFTQYQYSNFTTAGPWMTWSNGHFGCNRTTNGPMYYNRSTGSFVNYNSIGVSPSGVIDLTPVAWGNIPHTKNNYCSQQKPATGPDGYIDIMIRDTKNTLIPALYNQSVAYTALLPGPYTVRKIFVPGSLFSWGHPLNGAGVQTGNVWDTGARTIAGGRIYRAGTYTATAESVLNGMKDNYKMGGADYTGKTVSPARSITLWGNDLLGVFRQSNGTWYLEVTNDGLTDRQVKLGGAGDTAVVGDWDGNGFVDIGVFRNRTGYWYLDDNLNGIADRTLHLGQSGDQPVVGDFNGDGRSGIGVFRPSTGAWYLDNGPDGISDIAVQLGQSGDIPVTGDFNGDKKTDIGVFRPSTGTWYLDTNLDGVYDAAVLLGQSGDKPVTGDFNGDLQADIGVFRPSSGYWYLDYDHNGGIDRSIHLGATGDIPVVREFNGDLQADIGIFRPASGTWYLDYNQDGVIDKVIHLGMTGDAPVVGHLA
jgi:hypothetical protein